MAEEVTQEVIDRANEQMDFEVQWATLKRDFLLAKRDRTVDPEAYEAARKAMSDFRTYWRQVREAIGATADEGGVTIGVGVSKPNTEGN